MKHKIETSSLHPSAYTLSNVSHTQGLQNANYTELNLFEIIIHFFQYYFRSLFLNAADEAASDKVSKCA